MPLMRLPEGEKRPPDVFLMNQTVNQIYEQKNTDAVDAL